MTGASLLNSTELMGNLFILAYRVSDSYGGSHTSSLIEAAIERSKEFGYFNVAEVFSDKK